MAKYVLSLLFFDSLDERSQFFFHYHTLFPVFLSFSNLSIKFTAFFIFLQYNSDVFVLLACDGVYDVMGNQEIVDLLSYRLGCSGIVDL